MMPSMIADAIPLQAGPLSLVYEDGTLRYIRLGEHEILRQIYATVRDHNWGTVPAQIRDLQVETKPDSFRITFVSDHQEGDIHFVWKGTINGEVDGTIRFDFDGEALTSFQRNRVGFCVLHPMTVTALACDIEHSDGSVESGTFPQLVSPHQPFMDMRAITYEIVSGLRAEVRMTGDIFEMEDQRNWTDASYKTYCTPLGLPFPVKLEQGEKVRQSVTMRLIGQAPTLSLTDTIPVLQIEADSRPLPPIGLGVATDGVPLTAKAIERLKALNLSHLRVDLTADDKLQKQLQQAADEATACGCALEIALHLGEDITADLEKIKAAVEIVKPTIVRWLIFRKGEISTGRDTVLAARDSLESYGALGAGTDAFFAQLNRNRPPIHLLDWITYSINPQVHAFDNISIVETLTAQAITVESARHFAGSAQLAVSPVTLRMRWNPDATTPDPELVPGVLPKNVDPRQTSLFGAGWTVGSMAALAGAGADSLTYYETAGWLGLMDREDHVFPMYHVFADVGEFAGGRVLSSSSSAPLKVGGLALVKNNALRILLTNFTAQAQQLSVNGITGKFAVKSLDETTVEAATKTAETFRAQAGTPIEIGTDGLTITLPPYAVVRLDRIG